MLSIGLPMLTVLIGILLGQKGISDMKAAWTPRKSVNKKRWDKKR